MEKPSHAFPKRKGTYWILVKVHMGYRPTTLLKKSISL